MRLNALATGCSRRSLRCTLTLALIALASSNLYADPAPPQNLADLSLEELGNVIVNSVSRKQEQLSKAAASIYVISADDIRRSGATSLPEVLRLAPNLQVARIDAQNYAISARGFNSSTANKLQVLIDGRIIYTPLYSGVFWDSQTVVLDDIERIEVISGPASATWGSNAVNGVINIITRSAQDTQGNLLAVNSGNQAQNGVFRYGASLPSGGAYRVYALAQHDSESRNRQRGGRDDSWNKRQVGFRLDTEANGDLRVLGNAYSGSLDNASHDDGSVKGLNLSARWKGEAPDGGQVQLLGYLDHRERDLPGTYAQNLDILNVELQHNLPPRAAHQLIWGLSLRTAWDDVENSAAAAFLPDNTRLSWSSLFLQDEITLRDDLNLTLAGRIEYNSYTEYEFMPSARLAWALSDNSLLWGSLSRAVRTPSRLDKDLYIPGTTLELVGGSDFDSEVLRAFELGYRAQPSSQFNYSLTLFHHDYDQLRTINAIGNGQYVIGNEMQGSISGIEGWASLRITPDWKLTAGATAMDKQLELTSATAMSDFTGDDPDYQWRLVSQLNLSPRHELDLTLRRVGALPEYGLSAYTAFDMRLGWRPNPNTEVSLAGFNLFDPYHAEFGNSQTSNEFARSLMLKLKYTF